MVGAGTVRSDDPQLTVRYATGPNPLRVVPSSDGRLPSHSKLLNDGLPTLVVVPDAASDEAVAALRRSDAVEVMRCGSTRVDLAALMPALQARGVEKLMVEGGSRLLHSLHAAGLVSRIVIKHIPVIAGAPDAPIYLRADRGEPPLSLSRWRLVDVLALSGVAVTIYEPGDRP
jgi:5-amino-6-(5-phosphoribosylamino)uracil reductase/2,5-diamino-6-(ribosylamino)-4(3H)-pyrimidinone 5'-phosphate reductase